LTDDSSFNPIMGWRLPPNHITKLDREA